MATLEDLVRHHHRRLIAVEAQAAKTTGALWDRFGGPADDDLSAFVRHAVPVVAGAQRTAVDLMAGYLTAVATMVLRDRTVIAIPPAAVLEQLRGGIPLAEVYARPVITMRTALANGSSLDDARAAGRARATSAANTDVVLANRQAVATGTASDDRIHGYRRVLTGTSCELCAVASEDTYGSGDLMPIHNHCDCGVAPIIGTRDPGRSIDDQVLESHTDDNSAAGYAVVDGTVHRLEDRALGDPLKIAVHDHGELGPVLAEAGHEFTGPDAIAV